MGYRMNWDPKSYESQGGGDRNDDFDIHTMELPKWVRVSIIKAEMESTKADDGIMALLGMKITSDGPESGYAFWPRFLVESEKAVFDAAGRPENNMAVAVSIGRRNVAKIRDACDMSMEDDVEDLLGAELDVKVALEKGKRRKDGDGKYPDRLKPDDVADAGAHSRGGEGSENARYRPEARSQTPAPSGPELAGQRPDPTTVRDDPLDDIDF